MCRHDLFGPWDSLTQHLSTVSIWVLLAQPLKDSHALVLQCLLSTLMGANFLDYNIIFCEMTPEPPPKQGSWVLGICASSWPCLEATNCVGIINVKSHDGTGQGIFCQHAYCIVFSILTDLFTAVPNWHHAIHRRDFPALGFRAGDAP